MPILDGLVLHHVVLDQVVLEQKLQDTNTTTAVKTPRQGRANVSFFFFYPRQNHLLQFQKSPERQLILSSDEDQLDWETRVQHSNQLRQSQEQNLGGGGHWVTAVTERLLLQCVIRELCQQP